MGLTRALLLKASESPALAKRLPNYSFARRAVRRFMPGEDAEDALREGAELATRGVGTVLTRLGENITSLSEASAVTSHYAAVLADIRRRELPTHISVKLTQLGLDIDSRYAVESVTALMRHAAPDPIWIDMESSRYADVTIDVFNKARETGQNVGLCVQAYLHRTERDLEALLASSTAIRLVKGAYAEAPHVAMPKKSDVDENYFKLARMMLAQVKHGVIGNAPAFATHDVVMIKRIANLAQEMGVSRDHYEFQLLYGINTQEQQRLARDGYRMRVLISYGSAWFAWYMRRLAERPANVWFALKSLF